jgi:inosine-uridine nucleoside N-ribohydrolase
MQPENSFHKIPVILDTDIGGDIDDTWALAMMLNSPELDVKMVITEVGDTLYRAKIAAKILELAGRTDIPVAVGICTSHLIKDETKPQQAWVEGYDIGNYPGIIHHDGVSALIDTIMKSEDQITIIAIGPVTNLAEALKRQPEIALKAKFVGMQGNIRSFFADLDRIVPEYNVKCDIPSSRTVFEAPWDITITPLDTCGRIVLKDEKYARVLRSENTLAKAVMENYRLWVLYHGSKMDSRKYEKESSTLFDTVAVYLAFSDEFLQMEQLGIRITDDGTTLIDESAKRMNCAMEWKDRGAFEDFLVRRVVGQP